MDIIDYDIITSDNRILVFLKVEEYPTNAGKLSYKSLTNIIYKLSDGYCVADRKGSPLTVRDNLELCSEFLNEEYSKQYTVIRPLTIDVDET